MNVNKERRLFLKFCLAAGAVVTTVGVGLLSPRVALAIWPRVAFEAQSVDAALKALWGREKTKKRRYAITIKTRPYADDGGTKVTITVTTNIQDIESIALIITSNPTPLIACFKFYENQVEQVSTRTKMALDGEVIAVVKTSDRLYSNSQKVDLTGCGCG